MSVPSVVENVQTIAVNAAVIVTNAAAIVAAPLGLWMTVTSARGWEVWPTLVGLFLFAFSLLVGVTKKVGCNKNGWYIETHESPFSSWRKPVNRDGRKG